MSKASEYIKKMGPMVFRTDDGVEVASVGWATPDGQADKRVPVLNIRKAAKLILDAKNAAALGHWLCDVFDEPA